MIQDPDSVKRQISSWIKEQANEFNRGSLVVNASDGHAPSALVLYLCKKTQLPVVCILASDSPQEIINVCSNLNVSVTFVKTEIGPGYLEDIHKETILKARDTNALIVGNRCRNDVLFARQYPKFEPVDVLPLADLKLSEVYELYMSTGAKDVFMWTESSELPLIGATYPELEWLDELNKTTGIIDSDADPSKDHMWFRFTPRQKKVIAKMHQINKITMHKHNPNIPICRVK